MTPPLPPIITESSPPLAPRGQYGDARPGFWGAARGVWLLTWRSQFTLRGLWGPLLALLALPSLVFLITRPLDTTPRPFAIFGDPDQYLGRVSRRMERNHAPLEDQQRADLAQIVHEEFSKAETSWRSGSPTETPDEQFTRRRAQIGAWNGALLSRAEGALSEKQDREFRRIQQDSYNSLLNRSATPQWNRSTGFYYMLVDFYFFLALPLVCVRTCGALIRDELQADTLGFLTTRPTKRAFLLLAKYLSQTLWLHLVLLVESALLLSVGFAHDIPGLRSISLLFLAAQFLAVPVWCALGLLLGQVTTRYLAAGLVYGAVVEFGIGRIPTNVNTLSVMRHLKSLLANNDQLQKIFDWPNIAVWTPIGAVLLATAIFLAGAVALFTFREYHHNTEMQK